MPDKQLDHHEVMQKRPIVNLEVEIILVLDQLIFQENIAGICRIANSMGVKEVWLQAENKLTQSKSFRSISRLKPKNLRLTTFSESLVLKETIQDKIAEGFKVVALEYTDNSSSVVKWEPEDKIILIAGSERHGISKDLLGICHNAIHIPMLGDISSLNVNQAVSIAVWDIRRRQLAHEE